MARDYIPGNDNGLLDWTTNFVTKLDLYLELFGLVGGDLVPITQANTAFTGSLATHKEAQTAAAKATEKKNTDRTALVEVARSMARRVSNHPAMTNEIRADLGLNVPGSVAATSGVGIEVPDLDLEYIPGKVIVHFGTLPGNERLNSKPAWARGCNIYRKKDGESEYKLLDFATSSPYYDAVEGPAAIYSYIVRYRGTRVTDLGEGSIPGSISASGLMAA